jgi:hypothetical protein
MVMLYLLSVSRPDFAELICATQGGRHGIRVGGQRCCLALVLELSHL